MAASGPQPGRHRRTHPRRPDTDQTYEVRYGATGTDVFVLPLLAGMVLFGGLIIHEAIIDPTVPLWQVLLPLGPQILVLLGGFGLLVRLGAILGDRIALKISANGILTGTMWPFLGAFEWIQWPNLVRIELIRIKPSDAGPLPVRYRHIRVWRIGEDPRSTRPTSRLYLVGGLQKWATGMEVDRDRLKAAVRYHAPHVPIVDQW